MVDTKTLKYTKTHEWVRLEGKIATVGVTDYAQKEIRDIVFIEPPKINKQVKKGEAAGVIESVKAAFEIYAPVSGKVIAANEKAASDVTLVHKDPYGEGWLFKIEASDLSEAASLMNEEAYAKMAAEASH